MLEQTEVPTGSRKIRTIIETGIHKGKPKCVVDGCERPGQHQGKYRKDGSVIYRDKCQLHVALQYNMEGAHKLFKKNICENIDGRLGFVCTTTTLDQCQLEVDHVNNNHKDNNPDNLDTLCSCCHKYKTKHFSHYQSLQEIREIYAKNSAFTQNTVQDT